MERKRKFILNEYGFGIEVDSNGYPIPCEGCGWDFGKNINEVYCAFCQSCGECCACNDHSIKTSYWRRPK